MRDLGPMPPSSAFGWLARALSWQTRAPGWISRERALGWIARSRAPGWLEALLLTAAVPCVRWAGHVVDPLGIELAFPWLVVAPLWIGLQHGLPPALTSAGGLGAAMLLSARLFGEPASDRVGSVVAACGLLAAIGGQFRDRVQRRSDRAGRQIGELAAQLYRAQRSLRALEREHARALEQLAGASASAFRMRPGSPDLAAPLDLAQLGDWVLRELAGPTQLYAASLYAARSRFGQASRLGVGLAPRLELGPEPIAVFGAKVPGVADHPLVVRALRSSKLTAVVDGLPEPNLDDSVLAAVPLVVRGGAVLGVLAIHDMAFASFERSRLEAMFRWTADMSDVLGERWQRAQRELDAGMVAAQRTTRVRGGVAPQAADSNARAAERASAHAAARHPANVPRDRPEASTSEAGPPWGSLS